LTLNSASTVAVVADDLIWASRLTDAGARAGARAIRLGSDQDLEIALQASDLAEPGDEPSAMLVGVIVDLFGHRYDGVRAVQRVAGAGLPVIAVAQHDDLETRQRALAAGAGRVFSYQKFFTDGPNLVTGWLTADGGDR
jgi:DNA-binding response OmpR family regulator